MFDRVFKSAIALALLAIGVAALLWSQNGRYRYLSDGAALFDSRTGDLFLPEDSPDGAGKGIFRINQKTGQVSAVTRLNDPALLNQYQHKAAVDQQSALADCRSNMKATMARGKSVPENTRKSAAESAVSSFEADMEQPKASCVSVLLKNPSGVLESDRVLVSNFCGFYLSPPKGSDPQLAASCASMGRQ